MHTPTYTSSDMHTYICIYHTYICIRTCVHIHMCTCVHSSPQQFGKERQAQPLGLQTHGRTLCSVVCLAFSLPLREFARRERVQCQVCWKIFISRLVVKTCLRFSSYFRNADKIPCTCTHEETQVKFHACVHRFISCRRCRLASLSLLPPLSLSRARALARSLARSVSRFLSVPSFLHPYLSTLS